MAVLDYGYQVYLTSGDSLTPTGTSEYRIICIQSSVGETAVQWSIESASDSASVELTNSDSSSRKGNGVVAVEDDSYVGGEPIGMVGGVNYILDSNLTFNCNKTFSSGQMGVVWYQVVKS